MLTTMIQIPASPKAMNPAGVKLTTKMMIPTQPSQVGSSDLFLTSHREVARPGRGILPTVALGAGIVAAAGFLTAATLHFALADYAGDIDASAAQALNAIDSDFFLPFVMGLSTLILATSLWLVRNKSLLPTWLGWVGIIIFVVSFTPAGFIAFGLAGIWIIVVSILLYLRDETATVGSPSPVPTAR
jgi:hypothetical protein